MSKFLPVRLFFVWLLFGILLAGCGNSPSSDEEPPVYSPARVLTPEAPGKKTLGSSPLILDISNQDQGYLTAESDSDDSRMNIQLTAPSGVVYSYFLEPDEQTVLPFSEGSGEYLITCYQQVDGNQYAMLRSQDIPCKLQIGYSGDVKHAWIDVYIRGRGWVTKAVSFDGDTWKLMDPTFDANSDGDEAIQEYIGDESNYTVQFTR